MRPNYVILIFVYTPQTRRFINLHHVSSNNLKYTNKRHTSQTGNYQYNSKLSKDIQFEKKTLSSFKICKEINERTSGSGLLFEKG